MEKKLKYFFSKSEGIIDTKKVVTMVEVGIKFLSLMVHFNDNKRAKLWSENGYRELAMYLKNN